MKLSTILWIAAFLITAVSAIYQRVTGPTYPAKGEIVLNSKKIPYSFPRSHGGETNCPVEIQTGDPAITGTMDWKRFKSDDEWVTVPMSYQNEKLIGELPHQQPAGKLLYRVHLKKDETTVTITDGEGIVIRFKGDVPLFVLVPHILAMFVGMLLSTRAGLEIFNGNQNLKKLVYWTIGFLVVGGFVFGPFVQKYAFNAFWTGWPFGPDLTDNKTAFAVFSWIVAGLMIKWSPKPQRWALAAAIITLAVYLIPHSLLGSELDYQKEGQQKVAQMLEVDHRPTL